MFIFQSCYGVPAAYPNALVTGNVISSSNNHGIEGIKVSMATGYYYRDSAEIIYDYSDSCAVTDNKGQFSFHATLEGRRSHDAIFFEDIDNTENGLYEKKIVYIEGADKVHINVTLNEIQQDSTSLQ